MNFRFFTESLKLIAIPEKYILFFSLCFLSSYATAEEISVKDKSSPPGESALSERIEIERQTRFQKFVLTPHKQNYILPLTYNDSPNLDVIDPAIDGDISKTEVKFQLSIKVPVAENIFDTPATLYFAYTNLSFWQAYNSAASAPFRETNHEPEIFIGLPNDWELWGFKNNLVFTGFSHQSNGRSGIQSRSWNRFYIDFIFQKRDFYLSLKPWLRINDDVDDNPDIEDYLGHGEIRAIYAKSNHTVSLMMRHTFDENSKGAVELSWSFPVSRRTKGLLQIFKGYGESLLDYNAESNRIGLGVMLTDWL